MPFGAPLGVIVIAVIGAPPLVPAARRAVSVVGRVSPGLPAGPRDVAAKSRIETPTVMAGTSRICAIAGSDRTAATRNLMFLMTCKSRAGRRLVPAPGRGQTAGRE